MDLIRINNQLLYLTEPGFQLGLSDDEGNDEMHQFGVAFVIDDMDDATGAEEFAEYPYLVEASIALNQPHESFLKQAGIELPESEEEKRNLSIQECLSYMGGVPITHILMDEISTQGDSGLEGALRNVDQFKIHAKTQDYGTIAAQRGKKPFRYPSFASVEAAEKFCNNLVSRCGALSMMIGFILDRPINTMGRSGWTVIQTQAKGV